MTRDRTARLAAVVAVLAGLVSVLAVVIGGVRGTDLSAEVEQVLGGGEDVRVEDQDAVGPSPASGRDQEPGRGQNLPEWLPPLGVDQGVAGWSRALARLLGAPGRGEKRNAWRMRRSDALRGPGRAGSARRFAGSPARPSGGSGRTDRRDDPAGRRGPGRRPAAPQRQPARRPAGRPPDAPAPGRAPRPAPAPRPQSPQAAPPARPAPAPAPTPRSQAPPAPAPAPTPRPQAPPAPQASPPARPAPAPAPDRDPAPAPAPDSPSGDGSGDGAGDRGRGRGNGHGRDGAPGRNRDQEAG